MASRLSWPTRSIASGAGLAVLALIATLLAPPAVAYVGGTAAGEINSTSIDGGGSAPTVTGATTNDSASADITTITLNSPRTVLNLQDFNLTAEDTLNLVFTSRDDSVLLRVNGSATTNSFATISGTLNTLVGSVAGTVGGKVVLSAPDGIYAGPTARIRVGSLLATTANMTDAAFSEGTSRFEGAANSITLSSGAQIDADSSVGFVAPLVQQAATVGGAEALYASAASFVLTYDASQRLQSFTPTVGALGGLVDITGTENGGSVAVSTLSTSTGGGVHISHFATVKPSAPVASGFGYTTLSAGGGLGRVGDGMRPVPEAGAPAQSINVAGTIEGIGKVTSYSSGATTLSGRVHSPGNGVELHAADDLVIADPGAVTSANLAVLSTSADFVNNSGPDAVTTGTGGKWIVYAGDRDGNTYGGLNSANTALWGDTLATRAPTQLTGNRYVFASKQTLTFTSNNAHKTYGQDATNTLTYAVSGLQPGEPGAFLADTAGTAFSGEPALSSNGAPASALVPVPVSDTYPITIGKGTLYSDAGYGFAFNSAGRLSVASQQPEDTAPVIVATVTGTEGLNDWYTSDIAVSWSVTDPQSGVWSKTGCSDVTVTHDSASRTITCSAVSAGGSHSESVTIKRDTVRPALDPSVSPNPVSQNGTAAGSANASDAISGVASASCDPVETSTLGQHTVSCTATDLAGHSNTTNARYAVIAAPNKMVGFFAPVDNNGVLNRAKAGQVIPLKWRFLDADNQPITSLTSVSVGVSELDCSSAQSTDTIEQYATSAGSSQLQNLGDGYYQFNWQTRKTYATTCKTISMNVNDGTTPLTALFQFVK